MYVAIVAYLALQLSKKACFIQTQLHLEPIPESSSCTPIPRLPIDQSHPLENPSLRFLPIPTSGLHISPALQIHPSACASLAYSATIKFPALHIFRIASQIPLKRRPRRPPCYRAAYRTPRTDDDIDSTVPIGILGFRVCFLIRGFGGPIGILPHDESLVEGVEAVATKCAGVDRKWFLVAFCVGQVQGQCVSDPTFFL